MKSVTELIPWEKPIVAFVERPWGSFKQYTNNRDCTVCFLTVMPRQRLSMHSHRHRAELWIVIDDGAIVRVGEEERICKAGDEIWIPVNEKHRLSCNKEKPLRVLAISFGSWREEDISRHADDYHRTTSPFSAP
jgi:mannose-6-phosphate isomerase